MNKTKIFTGTSNESLANAIAKRLTGKAPDQAIVARFSDGEIQVEIKTNVRGCKAFIIQSTCTPVNETLMELLLLSDALRRSSVTEIIAVIPYFGYARQDRRPGYARVPVSARLVADMIEVSGIDHLVTVDLHATQIQGFFHIPVDNISATQLFVADIYKKWIHENPIIVSPDAGGVARARGVAKHLDNVDLAIVDKRRPKANVSEVMHIIGDVEDKTCIIIDDMADTSSTLVKAAEALMKSGARRVVAYVSHGVLSGKAKDNLLSPSLHELVITDSVPLSPELKSHTKIRQLSIENLLAETISRIDSGSSISEILD